MLCSAAAIDSVPQSSASAPREISPDEIRTVSKIYPMLGLESEQVYGDIHAMTAGAATASGANEPVMVIPALAPAGYAIPPRPLPAQGVRLNMTAVNAKLAESAQISAILGDIFTENDTVNLPTAIVRVSSGKLSHTHVALLSRLAERREWGRAEFEALATEYQLLPDGAIDALNEAAFEHAGGPVLEGDDPIQVDVITAKELLI